MERVFLWQFSFMRRCVSMYMKALKWNMLGSIYFKDKNELIYKRLPRILI